MAVSTIPKQSMAFRNLIEGTITGNGSYPLLVPISEVSEVLVSLVLSDSFRSSIIYSVSQMNFALPDIQMADGRAYMRLQVSGSNIVVSNYGGNLTNYRWSLSYR